jgi:hypothetical protein
LLRAAKNSSESARDKFYFGNLQTVRLQLD